MGFFSCMWIKISSQFGAIFGEFVFSEILVSPLWWISTPESHQFQLNRKLLCTKIHTWLLVRQRLIFVFSEIKNSGSILHRESYLETDFLKTVTILVLHTSITSFWVWRLPALSETPHNSLSYRWNSNIYKGVPGPSGIHRTNIMTCD